MKLLTRLPHSANAIKYKVSHLDFVSLSYHELLFNDAIFSQLATNPANFEEREIRILALLAGLLHELRGIMQLAERNLLVVAAQSPFYSVLHCIRYLLEDTPLS
jgi:hypothetical protein